MKLVIVCAMVYLAAVCWANPIDDKPKTLVATPIEDKSKTDADVKIEPIKLLNVGSPDTSRPKRSYPWGYGPRNTWGGWSGYSGCGWGGCGGPYSGPYSGPYYRYYGGPQVIHVWD